MLVAPAASTRWDEDDEEFDDDDERQGENFTLQIGDGGPTTPPMPSSSLLVIIRCSVLNPLIG